MSQRFDELSKAISKARSRRDMLKMIGGAVAGALAATVMPSGGTPTASADYVVNSSCPPGYTPCGFGFVNSTSIPGCCSPGQLCVHGDGLFSVGGGCMPAAEATQACRQVCQGYSVNGTFFGGPFNDCMSRCLGVTYPFVG